MKKISFFNFLKINIILLLAYNVLTIVILYFPSTNIKKSLWQWTPYNYEQILYFPNNLRNLSLLSKSNRDLTISFMNKNIYKDYLNIDFWDYKQILESIDKKNIKEFEQSFFKTFALSKNNEKINKELRDYFINNYSKFSNRYKNKILKNFFN